jgi:DNA polymerase III epsilon subunit-like protein
MKPMKLISIDIETTGLDPATCHVLEIGAVIFDPQPELDPAIRFRPATFERIIKCSRIQGEPYALQMNADLIAEIAGTKKTHVPIRTAVEMVGDFRDFLEENLEEGEKATIVGKNYDAFDRQFLNRVNGWNVVTKNRLARRVLDVGSLCFCPDDGEVQNLTKCLAKLGVRDEVTHRALDDALQCMTVVTRFFA